MVPPLVLRLCVLATSTDTHGRNVALPLSSVVPRCAGLMQQPSEFVAHSSNTIASASSSAVVLEDRSRLITSIACGVQVAQRTGRGWGTVNGVESECAYQHTTQLLLLISCPAPQASVSPPPFEPEPRILPSNPSPPSGSAS